MRVEGKSVSVAIPVEAMCHHAEQSCRVNGLHPVAWRWGRDVRDAAKVNPHGQMANGAVAFFWGLPVYRMKADGVACIGKR